MMGIYWSKPISVDLGFAAGGITVICVGCEGGSKRFSFCVEM